EEHSHCEVPAGCGGVVLRWRNPAAGTPVVVYTFGGEVEALINGVPVNVSRALAPTGANVLAVHLRVEAPMPFLFATMHNLPGEALEGTPLFTSADDGSWVATTVAPEGNAWMTDPFEDAGWRPLGRSTVDPNILHEHKRWHFNRIVNFGAVP